MFYLTPSQEYKCNTSLLINLSQKSHSLYECILVSLKFSKKIGLPIIGNPKLKLKNQVLTLVYTIMQHEINCGLYEELILENPTNQSVRLQLDGMYEMTNLLSIKYQKYLGEWDILKNQEEKIYSNFDNLPISA